MNKRLNCLALLPLYGSIILLFWIFTRVMKHEISIKKFYKYVISCGLFGGLSFFVLMLFLFFINTLVDITNYFGYGILIVAVLGGYLFNLFTFSLVNKRWDDLIEL